MVALGHGSKAMARAYSKHAQVSLPSLEDFEKQTSGKVIEFPAEKNLGQKRSDGLSMASGRENGAATAE